MSKMWVKPIMFTIIKIGFNCRTFQLKGNVWSLSCHLSSYFSLCLFFVLLPSTSCHTIPILLPLILERKRVKIHFTLFSISFVVGCCERSQNFARIGKQPSMHNIKLYDEHFSRFYYSLLELPEKYLYI